jgi:hypothetical protein
MIDFGVTERESSTCRREVVIFLSGFKALASKNGLVVFQRQDYKETLTELAIHPSQAKEMILGLTVENYYKGLGQGERDGEEVCELGLVDNGRELYIKLMIDNTHERAICCSFHFPERKIEYPFAEHVGQGGDHVSCFLPEMQE